MQILRFWDEFSILMNGRFRFVCGLRFGDGVARLMLHLLGLFWLGILCKRVEGRGFVCIMCLGKFGEFSNMVYVDGEITCVGPKLFIFRKSIEMGSR